MSENMIYSNGGAIKPRKGWSRYAKIPAVRKGTGREITSLVVHKGELFASSGEGIFVYKEKLFGLIRYFKQVQFSND